MTQEQLPEPPPIPRAVEIRIDILVGDEKGLFKDAEGEPLVETHYMLVPILAAQSMVLDEELIPEDDLDAGADAGTGGDGGAQPRG